MLRVLGATVLVVAFAAGTGAAARPATVAKPSLRLVSTQPLQVKGAHFEAGERIRVRVSLGPALSLRASSSGAFGAKFRTLFVDLCNGDVTVRADGSDGSTARLKLPKRQCPPALS